MQVGATIRRAARLMLKEKEKAMSYEPGKMAVGIAVGVGVGAGIGAALGDVPVGIAIGIALGAAASGFVRG
jgi:hypothetical protein